VHCRVGFIEQLNEPHEITTSLNDFKTLLSEHFFICFCVY